MNKFEGWVQLDSLKFSLAVLTLVLTLFPKWNVDFKKSAKVD